MVGGSLLGGGCTAGSPPGALEQARTTYTQAQQTPQVATQAPVALQEADQALQRAERVMTPLFFAWTVFPLRHRVLHAAKSGFPRLTRSGIGANINERGRNLR